MSILKKNNTKGVYMAIPKVFISSTCYDLKYIRENLLYFIENIGFEAILSEESRIFYNPMIHVQDSCLNEVRNCQIFVLIIGGRFGSKFKETEYSITNAEYKEAIKNKIPIFTLVEENVYNQSFVYEENKMNDEIDETKIKYPAIDSIKIFDFINEVKHNTYNNAIVSFKNFSGIENYLKNQWAGMLYSFLIEKNNKEKYDEQFNYLKDISNKIEVISNQILRSVGTQKAKVIKLLYEILVDEKNKYIEKRKSFIQFYGHEEEIYNILQFEEYYDYLKVKYERIIIRNNMSENKNRTLSSITKDEVFMAEDHYEELRKIYSDIRKKLISKINEHGWKLEDIFEG